MFTLNQFENWKCFKGLCSLKSIETRPSYLYACFAPNRLELLPKHVFVAVDSHFHIVYNDLKLHPE